MANRRKKKGRPFRPGQKVKYKNQKTNAYGLVWSAGPASIGDPNRCKIPGGPLILEDYIYVQWIIKGKKYICIESIDELEIFKST